MRTCASLTGGPVQVEAFPENRIVLASSYLHVCMAHLVVSHLSRRIWDMAAESRGRVAGPFASNFDPFETWATASSSIAVFNYVRACAWCPPPY